MKKIILIILTHLFVNNLAIGQESQLNSKIISGQEANLTLPWMAGMFVSTNNSSCSHSDDCYDQFLFSCAASLIHEKWLVTAAHCVHQNSVLLNPEAFKLFLGESSLDAVQDFLTVEQVIVHENYGQDDGFKYDIALLELQTPVAFEPIDIVSQGKESLITAGTAMLLAGWGREIQDGYYIYPDSLQMTQLEFVEFDVCEEIFEPFTTLEQTQMCAGGNGVSDACDGDSGGALLVNQAGRWKMVGLVSFGVPTCALTGFPSVFTRMSQFNDWIESKGVPANESSFGSFNLLCLMMLCAFVGVFISVRRQKL